jgi:serine protease Do
MKQKIAYIITIIFAFFVGIICTLYVTDYLKEDVVVNKTSLEITESDTIKPAIDKIYDAVVLIETYDSNNRGLGSGTGFVYKVDENKGYILTNHHVVDGASNIIITLSSGEEVNAEFLGSDEYSDVAVISISKEKVLAVAKLGDSSNTELGDTVFTVGSPLGSKYMGSVTKGILSGKDRQVTVTVSSGSLLIDVIQTDAAINPGNSGGPLVNINGEVIGITSLKLVEDEIEGMGFALPIEYALTYTERLENGEEIVRPVLGVQLSDLSSSYLLKSLNINIDSSVKKGVVLLKIEKDSNAYVSGLEVGDIITKINNDEIEDTASFRYSLYKYSIGDTIEITYIRKDKEYKTQVKLTETLE